MEEVKVPTVKRPLRRLARFIAGDFERNALEPRHRISHSSARSLVRTRRKNHYGSIALQRYLTGVKGDPSGISGQCGRMLYFSVVVMTTSGLGDIVPMTSRSRGLVAGEAIFGITFAIVGDAARGILARLVPEQWSKMLADILVGECAVDEEEQQHDVAERLDARVGEAKPRRAGCRW